MLEPVLENGLARKGEASGQPALPTTPPSLHSSPARPGQPSLSRNPHNLPRDPQSPRADRLTELPSPKRLTPETMLTHLHTIQHEEQKRLSKRRQSSTAVDVSSSSSTLHLPPPSPITSAPSSQSPTGGGHPPQPHDGGDDDDDDDDHILTNPYASFTPHQLSVATSRLHDIAQQFQDVVAGLQDAITRRQSTTTTPPRPELLTLQERLARVHSVAITEHEMVVREVKARRGGGEGEGEEGPKKLPRDQGAIIRKGPPPKDSLSLSVSFSAGPTTFGRTSAFGEPPGRVIVRLPTAGGGESFPSLTRRRVEGPLWSAPPSRLLGNEDCR